MKSATQDQNKDKAGSVWVRANDLGKGMNLFVTLTMSKREEPQAKSKEKDEY